MQTLLNPVQSLGSSQGMSRHTESIVAVYQQQGDAIPQDGRDPTSGPYPLHGVSMIDGF